MIELPSGTVTFLFTDIEGSTRLIKELGQEGYVLALAEHRRLLRDSFSSHGGIEVDTQGDAFLYVFADPGEALAAAAQGRDALASSPVRVRMGIHTGEALRTEEGYAGHELHRAARIAASGHGGQIVVSTATRALVEGELTELGEHRLKDFSEPVALFQLGSERFPPLKTISNTNLPRPASSFIGRVREREELVALLTGAARLVTLTGPGGSGKTRLALEVASELIPTFKAGVFWVALAPVSDPALVTETVAQMLGAKGALSEHVGERELLLFIDNFEQVAEAAPDLSRLLEACPKLRLLVTSRELLRIRGEVEYPVLPLPEPEAVELFCQRSRLERDDTTAELCRRLDNLPLAIELAAARTSVLTPAQILDRLGRRLDLLKGGRDVDPRQQTLRGAIGWSHDLISGEEQRLFARLSVFAGGCTLEAAEAVCDADLDVLQSLVDKSLLRHLGDRFWMLETIREFAAERLEAAPEANAVRAAHAEFFASLAERSEPHLRGAEQQEWAERLATEFDNIRAAVAIGLVEAPEIALRIVGSLAVFFWLRGGYAEARTWVDAALAAGADAALRRKGRALVCGAVVAERLGDGEAAIRYSDEGIAVATAAGDGFGIAWALCQRANAAWMVGEVERARAIYEGLSEPAGEDNGVAWISGIALNNLGGLAIIDGDWPRAIELCRRSSDLRRRQGNRWGAALALTNVAHAQLQAGLVDDAARTLRQALEDSLAVNARMVLLACLAMGATIYADRQKPRETATLLGAHDQLLEELGASLEDADRAILEGIASDARARLGDEDFERVYEHGRSLPTEDAAAVALALTEDAPDQPAESHGPAKLAAR